MTRNDDTELNVLPWLAVAALLAAVAALSFAIVALGQSDDNGPAAGSAAMGGMSGDMEHIAPLPIDGIEHARARREGCRSSGWSATAPGVSSSRRDRCGGRSSQSRRCPPTPTTASSRGRRFASRTASGSGCRAGPAHRTRGDDSLPRRRRSPRRRLRPSDGHLAQDRGRHLVHGLPFTALIVSSIVLAVALVKADGSRVRFIWAAAALLAMGAMFGYFVSRAIALPGMADHQGDWFSSIGIFSWLFELGLVGLAAFALRDRVVRVQAQRRVRRRARVAVPAMSPLGLLGVQPATALAHNGEEMTPEEMAAAEMGHDPGSMDHTAVSHDPLLGGTELGVVFAIGLALIGWAGMALRSRVAPMPRTRRPRSGVGRPPRPGPEVVAVRGPS